MDPATMMLLAKAGMAAYQGIKSYSNQKDAERAAQRAAAKMRAIKETDYSMGLQVPTLGAELARQSFAQSEATSLRTLQSAGALGVLGGVTNLANQSTDRILQIAAGLQSAEYERDKFRMQQQQALESRQITREMSMAGMELSGAQAAVAESKRGIQEAGKLAAGAVGDYAEMKLKYSDLYPQSNEKAIVNKRLSEGGMSMSDLKNLEPETPYTSVTERTSLTPNEEALFSVQDMSIEQATDLEGLPATPAASMPTDVPFSPYMGKEYRKDLYTPFYIPQLQPAPNSFPIMPPGLR